MEKQSISGKRRARKLAMQAIYQWSMSDHDLFEIEAQFRVANNMARVDADYFCRLLHGIPKQLAELENKLSPYLDRPIEQLNPVELSILRLGGFELLYCPEIPYRVVLDESISLAKEFGSQDGYRYVNGVLNNLAQEVRVIEIRLHNE